jgi:hypothetical protein
MVLLCEAVGSWKAIVTALTKVAKTMHVSEIEFEAWHSVAGLAASTACSRNAPPVNTCSRAGGRLINLSILRDY